MTHFEIILILIIWIGYGIFSAYQMNDDSFDGDDEFVFIMTIIIIFSPCIAAWRILKGLFSPKIFK